MLLIIYVQAECVMRKASHMTTNFPVCLLVAMTPEPSESRLFESAEERWFHLKSIIWVIEQARKHQTTANLMTGFPHDYDLKDADNSDRLAR